MLLDFRPIDFLSRTAGRALVLSCGLSALWPVQAAVSSSGAAALLAKYETLTGPLSQNAFQRPMYLESSEASGGLKGDIYAVVEQPFAVIDAALNSPTQWCEAMILHINNRQCQLSNPNGNSNGTTMVTLSIVRKYDQPLEQAFRVPFAYRKETHSAGYFSSRLSADSGPMGTSNYQIVLEAVPLAGKRSFLHFAYSYDTNFIAKATMAAYLATFGSSKMGFTVVQPLIQSEPVGEGSREIKQELVYIRGMRGLMERNAMRYYLAIEAYLAHMTAPVSEQLDKRLNSWFTQIERYPKQLHEADRATYLRLKRVDYAAMQSTLGTASETATGTGTAPVR
jgi:hypothetical protein